MSSLFSWSFFNDVIRKEVPTHDKCHQTTGNNNCKAKGWNKQSSWPNYSSHGCLQLQTHQNIEHAHYGDNPLGWHRVMTPVRRYSEYTKPDICFTYKPRWLSIGLVDRSPTSGSRLGFYRPQGQSSGAKVKVKRRKSDSLYTYVPKAFRNQDASVYLCGQTNQNNFPVNYIATSNNLSKHTPQIKTFKLKKREPSSSRNISSQCKLELKPKIQKTNTTLCPLLHDSSDWDTDDDDNMFYFAPSMLIGCFPVHSTGSDEILIRDEKNSTEPRLLKEKSLNHVPAIRSINIKTERDKSVNNEVDHVLTQLETDDHFIDSRGIDRDGIHCNQEFLY